VQYALKSDNLPGQGEEPLLPPICKAFTLPALQEPDVPDNTC